MFLSFYFFCLSTDLLEFTANTVNIIMFYVVYQIKYSLYDGNEWQYVNRKTDFLC